MSDPSSDLEAVRRERDYYLSLLRLAAHDEPVALLDHALRLLVEITGSREGYIELYHDGDARTVTFSARVGCDEARAEEIRAATSRGIIAEAIATGEVVLTSSAIHDPRFQDLESVRDHAIEAVVCAPIGRATPMGIAYLQGRRGDAPAAGPEAVLRHVELFATSIAPLAEVLLRDIASEPRSAHALDEDAFSSIAGRSTVMKDVVTRLRFAAPLDVHVLLTGPTGSGKTLLAHAIHACSARRAASFVELNCAAIPDALLENELFGADPGAHSAVPRGGVVGRVEQAEGGTLFLDEVAELSLVAQAKLLHLLQSKSYARLGAGKTRRADIRVIAATNTDLAAAVAEQQFREDLYYRLKVLEVRVPSLAERPEDIVPLASHFCREAARKHDWPSVRLSPNALRALASMDWPGNVRELANQMETAVIHCRMRGGDRVETRDLFGTAPADDAGVTTFHEAMRSFQRKHLLAVLGETEWNVTEAARRLDLTRSHLYNLIRLHEIRRAG